ncbi:hypothetical protein BDW42DRAFT_183850 [Aspergillus taichungensis]|uniref:Protein kinase domain-containing protein n=1 Tax=Aspergillus taichungensis TaxID=482145 RepID=A0A2J5I2J3_9EURO|nr:hypothetical protein BDW42DRAFT_183850 [Aspergillus taichungensis]
MNHAPIQPPKPEIQYAMGRKFTIQSHIAPAPTRVTRGCCLNGIQEREETLASNPVERCLRHPPLAGSRDSSEIDLEIHDLIRVGDGHNAQLLLVDKLVAKVYDPLYFDDDDGYIDVFACVDEHYTHEVHAYHVLAEFQGNSIPRFYGSFSLDIPCEGSANRVSMRQVSATRYPQATRQQIMKIVVVFESSVHEKDIALTDLSLRNVMISDHVDDVNRGLVFVDFGGAIFGRRLDEPVLPGVNLFLGQYVSSLLRWKSDITMQFMEWVDWEWLSWMEGEFGDTAASITDEMRGLYCQE